MSKSVYITWVSPDLARDPVVSQVMARALDNEPDTREHVIVVCSRKVYESIVAGPWFMYGEQPAETDDADAMAATKAAIRGLPWSHKDDAESERLSE